jgi:hypothetical protein
LPVRTVDGREGYGYTENCEAERFPGGLHRVAC